MKLIGALVASCLLTLGASRADASVVNFQGRLDSGTGGILGTLSSNSPVCFNLQVFFDDADSPPNATGVTGGTFNLLSPAMNFTVDPKDSSIRVQKGPDLVEFVINVTNPTATGTLAFTFERTGAVGAPPTANQTTIDALVQGNSANFTATLKNGLAGVPVAYTGVAGVACVPEPSSCLALLALVSGGAYRFRRNRQPPSAA